VFGLRVLFTVPNFNTIEGQLEQFFYECPVSDEARVSQAGYRPGPVQDFEGLLRVRPLARNIGGLPPGQIPVEGVSS
jgi:hypothetical protein